MRTKIEGNYAVTLKGIIVAFQESLMSNGGGGQGEFISPPNLTQQLGCIRLYCYTDFCQNYIPVHPGACIIEGIPISVDK